jgi:hypothetical protein
MGSKVGLLADIVTSFGTISSDTTEHEGDPLLSKVLSLDNIQIVYVIIE